MKLAWGQYLESRLAETTIGGEGLHEKQFLPQFPHHHQTCAVCEATLPARAYGSGCNQSN
jgi:hypothetical protein